MTVGSMQMSLAQPINTISATKKHKLGMLYVDALGRKYRYAKAGATALAAGELTAAPAVTAHHKDASVAAATPIGATTVSVTVGATAVTADYYADGYLQVNDGTGEGHCYAIAGNSACDASTTTVVKLYEPIRVALVASATSEVTLVPSPYSGTVISATPEAFCTGVTPLVVTAAYYYWTQTGGPCVCLAGGNAIAVGSQIILGGTDGSYDVVATSSDVDVPKIGYQFGIASVTGEYQPIYLQID